ncbi:hypothetical protein DID88_007562 [Monilinia fructigena]|uniref:Galactose oxidase n=1 Tax=Monilinia fructigena TaxID=38457 RepID=A0A395J7V3_9HELO|nr:hypothetical protein DID88_007562 [Monilinia fructigena]
MRTKSFFVLWTLLVLIAISNAQTLPYNPTTILLPSSSSETDDVAFIFLVASESDTRPEFLFLNISATIFASNLTLEPFTPNLSFLDNNTAFVPTIGTYGDISLLTGSCSTPSSTELWTYTPENGAAGNGTWIKQEITVATDISSTGAAGADFLSKGFQFSTLVNANATYTDIYVYGGMCPRPSANISTWQSDAEYSNHMVRLLPGSESSYNLDLTANRGSPVAEAGFTATALTPSYSNASGIMTQAQNFILLGGHTNNAFINMSQVAIWSLPEESWSFVTVDSPSSTGGSNTELMLKSSVTRIDSRSGHTAVLTEDGSKVIVLGGWVGNVNQAADPQLAVLELGTGFGGSGDWKMVGTCESTIWRWVLWARCSNASWKCHDVLSDPCSSMLRVQHGYQITPIQLWCLIRWRKRRERRHEARERDLQSLSYNAAIAYLGPQEMSQTRSYSDSHEQYYDPGNAAESYEGLRTGEYVQGEVGSSNLRPRQVPRKALRNARGLYQPALTFDPSAVAGNVRASNIGIAGPIHPIYEADEDVDVISPIERYYTLVRFPTQEIEREIEAWVADWAAADALLHAQAKSHSTFGRNSPSRRANLITATGPASVSGELSEDSGRTASNLSERSMAPSVATLSRSGSGSQGATSNSLRGYITYAMNTITSGNAALIPMPDSPNAQTQPPGSSDSENTASTFTTAHSHSSFPKLQAEGVTLLPRPEQLTDQGPPSPTISLPRSPPRTPTRTTTAYVGSPSKNKPTGLGRRGWLGSLRKVFSPEGETAVEPTLNDREPSPISIGIDTSPRRTVSAGAALWRRKQGRGDWEDSEKIGAKRGRSNSLMNGNRPSIQGAKTGEARGLVNAIDEDDDEWDIERAIEDRVVQVMFTVPRERLRVVNHDVREDMSEGGSLGGRSRVASASGTLSRHPSQTLSREDDTNLARTESVESGGSKRRVRGKGKVSELVEMMEVGVVPGANESDLCYLLCYV